ncbi:hypothetical protein WMY93_032542 [Mugilogobius chulae]|uniref:NACHT domain-containing protein n=1 Tax=Mugilogobius chulae TaxID=88201 RepID=A0AAW0MJA6_9GOBI
MFVLLLVVAGVIVFFLWKRKKSKENQTLQTPGREEQGLPKKTLEVLSKGESQKFQTYLQDQSLMGEFQILHRKDVEKDGLIKSLLHVYGENSFTVTQRLLEHLQRNKKLKSTLTQRFKFLPEDLRGTTEKMEFREGFTDLSITVTESEQIHQTNQELQLLFPFTFRELNVLRDTQFSLVQLLQHFFSPSKDLCSFTQLQVLFIFDGLDECRLPLDFSRTRVLTDPTESVSVDVLLVNLIRGSLLPSALLWITTRPAAANQIPAECVSMVTEVRGFTDLQKEQYFRKSSTEASGTNREPELPRTLTQMYVHFLVLQAKVKNIKYHQGSGADLHWTPETRDMVLSLSKLAFEQLQKGNLIFYQSDLSECGLDAEEAARYSGVFTQVFRADPGEYQTLKVFLAALHVHQALQSPNGHLDLFLRFLLGLSLPTNQRLLQGLLTHTGSDTTNQRTVEYIKQKLNEESLLVKEIQRHMRLRQIPDQDMSPAQWSALSFVLLSSDSDLQEFDLRKYEASERALLGLLPVVKASTKALLSGCGLSPHSCGPLASVLSSSSLTHLDLSHNDLQDSGVKLLCEGLKSAPCRLHTLRLSGCLVSERGGAALASALSSAHSRVTELDLSYNHPGPSAELLTALQRPLQSVRLVLLENSSWFQV